MPEMLKLSNSLVACLLATAGGAVTPAPPATARVRVAHVSPGAPAVDFCLARHGTTQFTGPVLAAPAAPPACRTRPSPGTSTSTPAPER